MSKELLPMYRFETLPKSITKHYIVVGAGGTGGYVIPQLTRMVSIANSETLKQVPDTITIIDKDIVEAKNLKRQNFISDDLGKNKAEVMQYRYGMGFNFDIKSIPAYIESPEMLSELMINLSTPDSLVVLVDCTDNNKTRILMHHAIELYNAAKASTLGVYFVSSGNEEMHGQVSFSAKLKVQRLPKIKDDNIKNEKLSSLKDIDKLDFFESLDSSEIFNIPDICELFPNMEIGKLPDEESCAERAVSAPQNIQTNYMAADIVLGFLNKIVNGMPITQFLVFFDIINSSTTPFVFTTKDLQKAFNLVPGNPYLTKYIRAPKGYESVSDLLIPSFQQLEELRKEELKKEEEELTKLEETFNEKPAAEAKIDKDEEKEIVKEVLEKVISEDRIEESDILESEDYSPF